MGCVRAWLLLILLAGCSAKTADVPDEVPTVGALSGVTVTPGVEPLPGALVDLQPLGVNRTSDTFGRFRFSDLAPGAYQVTASAPGHATATMQIQIEAGQTTRPRIMLPLAPPPVPTHETLEFQGYIPAGMGAAHDVLPILASQFGDCTCRFEIPTSEATVAVVVEAVWVDNIQRPDEPPHLRWVAQLDNGTLEGSGPSPLHALLEGGVQGGVLLEILPDAVWPAYDQPFQLFVTRWDVEAPPEGWSRVRGDA